MRLNMDNISNFSFFILFLSFFVITRTCLASGNLTTRGSCIEGERQGLLYIKNSFTDSSHRLSSWEGKDCCSSWYGVSCDATTGHVIKLHLPNTNLIESRNAHAPRGTFSNNALSHVQYLNLSSNSFEGKIPNFIQNMTSLRILDLSRNRFNSSVPPFLGRLKNLRVLLLVDNSFSRLIPESIGELSALTEFRLTYTRITGPIPSSFGKLSALKILHLNNNNLNGSLPSSIGGMSALTDLDISVNELSGVIPVSIGRLKSLRNLNLHFNRLSGAIPTSLGLLSNLESLEIEFNSLRGVISEAHFAKTSMLKYIDARYNPNLIFKMRLNWVPPFLLTTLYAGDCNVGPQFPDWLKGQNQLDILDFSNSSISGDLPSWFRGLRVTTFIASLNHITGPLTNLPSRIHFVDLSRNNITGHLMSNLPSSLTQVYLSRNHITGGIPSNIGYLQFLTALDLSNNSLSGQIPRSVTKLTSLANFNVSYNNLSGRIPTGNNIQILSDPSNYIGNPGLCGAPLPRKCPN